MANPGQFEIPEMGGMNDGMHPSAIKDTEFQELYNFIVFGGKLTRRGGVKNSVKNPGPQDAVFNSIFLYSYAQNKGVVIIGADVGLFKLEPGTDLHLTDVATLPSTSAFSSGSLTYPWHFTQVNGIGYAVRRGVGLRRFERDYHSPAGITPPAWAPVLAEGVAGAISAGAYIAVATYRNSRTGAESNPGVASNTLTLAANKEINWSGFSASSDPQVDTIRLWRTLPDQTDSYFLIASIPVNDPTYTDNLTIDEVGGLVSNDNGLPPAGARSCCIWEDSLVLHDGTDVYISEILLHESYSDNILNVYRNDGAEIRGVLGWGTKLVVAKTNKMHYFTRTATRTFARKTMDDRNGCVSQKSMKVIGSELFWFSGNSKNICRSSGYGSEQVVNTELRSLLDRYEVSDPDTGIDEMISAVVWPQKNLYILSLPLDGAAFNTHTICYNFKDNTFSVFDYGSGHAPLDANDPSILDPLGDDQLSGDILAVFGDNRVYRYLNRDENWGQDDYGGGSGITTFSISARLLTKMFSQKGLLIANKFVWMLTELVGDLRKCDVQISLYLDGQTTPYSCGLFSFRTATKTSDLIDQYEPDRDGVPNPWKVFGVDNTRKIADLIQIGVAYTDRPAIEISQMALDASVFKRTHKAAYGVPCGTVIPDRPDPPPPPDPLVISNVAATTPDETFPFSTITWDTNRAADSTIEWGLTVAYGNTINDPTEVTSHSVDTDVVVGGTLYHYRVTSYESATGLTEVSADGTFTSGVI